MRLVIKTDASHPMYKTDKNMQNAVVVCRFFLKFCVILRMRPVGSFSFRQTQHNRKPWICMQGARSIKEKESKVEEKIK
jgi:hypothetical protein